MAYEYYFDTETNTLNEFSLPPLLPPPFLACNWLKIALFCSCSILHTHTLVLTVPTISLCNIPLYCHEISKPKKKSKREEERERESEKQKESERGRDREDFLAVLLT